jgi:hypothetical protein
VDELGRLLQQDSPHANSGELMGTRNASHKPTQVFLRVAF